MATNGNGNGRRRRNGRGLVDMIALILTVTLSLVLVITVIALLFFDANLGEEGGRLLTSIGLTMSGALAAYIGARSSRHGNGNGGAK